MHALIKSKLPRFRRANIEFSRAGVVVDLDTLTEAQIKAIYAEAQLTVELLDVPPNTNTASAATQPTPDGGEPPSGGPDAAPSQTLPQSERGETGQGTDMAGANVRREESETAPAVEAAIDANAAKTAAPAPAVAPVAGVASTTPVAKPAKPAKTKAKAQ